MMLRPLGVFERALFISDRHDPFNVVCLLRMENPPEPWILQEALALVQQRHPLLQARILEHRGRLWFEVLEKPFVPFTLMEWEGEESWEARVDREMNTRLDPAAGTLFRAVYHYGGQEGELLLTFHHAILDAVSGMALLDELLSACAALRDGQVPDLPPLPVPPPVEEAFPPAFRGLRGASPTARYALAQLGDELRFWWRARGRHIPKVNQGGEGRCLALTLPEELTTRLGRRARVEKVTLNSVLNAALLLAVNRRWYGGQRTPMRTFSFADLRPFTIPIIPPETVANCISMMRFTQTVSGTDNVWSLAKALHAQVYRALKTGDKFIATQMSERLMKVFTSLKSLRMGSVALSYTGLLTIKPFYGEMRVVEVHGFLSSINLGPEFSALARLFEEKLWLDFMYRDSDLSREQAGEIVAEVRAILESAAWETRSEAARAVEQDSANRQE